MRAKSVKERIAHFEIVHTNKYDYSLLSEPIRWNTKIDVICHKHGIFNTMVNNHSRGAGCPRCSHSYQPTKDERIDAARTVHGDRYDYSLLPIKINASTSIDIICKEHGKFSQTVANHINHKSGCPKCSNSIERTYAKFIRQANLIHGDRYGYKYYEKVTGSSKINIICSIHGEFNQSVGAHLAGKGCQSCGANSVSMNEEAVVYILKSEGVFKVGVSSRLGDRISKLERSTPFGFDVIHTKKFKKRADAIASEREILKSFPSANFSGFDGATEWLVGDPCL